MTLGIFLALAKLVCNLVILWCLLSMQRLNSQASSWYCGCGHTNGINLATYAACGRKANGEHP